MNQALQIAYALVLLGAIVALVVEMGRRKG